MLELEGLNKQIIDLIRDFDSVPDTVDLEDRLIDDLGCDSLDLVELSMHIENEIGVDIYFYLENGYLEGENPRTSGDIHDIKVIDVINAVKATLAEKQ